MSTYSMTKKDSIADLAAIGDFTYFDDGKRATCLCVVIPWPGGQQIMTEEYPIQHPFRENYEAYRDVEEIKDGETITVRKLITVSGHAWPWDGEEDKPTVNHSFHFKGKWDGVVLNGEIRDL